MVLGCREYGIAYSRHSSRFPERLAQLHQYVAGGEEGKQTAADTKTPKVIFDLYSLTPDLHE